MEFRHRSSGVPVIARAFLDIVTWICGSEACIADIRTGRGDNICNACVVCDDIWLDEISLSQDLPGRRV
jgi:hypothetical protein